MGQSMSDRLARPSPEGQEIGGCRLVRRLSAGGLGAVYLARQHRLGDRFVAVKVIPLDASTLGPQHEPIASIEQRFVREGKLLGHLTHPHILPVHDAGAEGNLLYLIMQYAPDGSLMDALRGRGPHPLTLPLPLPFALDLLSQVASALQYIHEHGIVHRDVKPSNILIHVESEGHWHVMLADFGIARAADSTAQQHLLAGTLAYMAPEQYRGFYSPASDQYALAVVAYLLLTGHLPFEGNAAAQVHGHLNERPAPLRASNPALPPPVEQVILRALAKQPAARFPSVAAFIAALRFGAVSDAPTTTRPGITAPLPQPLLLSPLAPARAAEAPPPFAIAPPAPNAQVTRDALPAIIPAGHMPGSGTSTTEAAVPPGYAASAEPARRSRQDASRPRTVRRRRRSVTFLSVLAALLVALVVAFAFHSKGQTANGANQPPFRSMSGATAVAATATATTNSPSSGGNPTSSPVPTVAATSIPGGGQTPPTVAPPAATPGAGIAPSVPKNAAQVAAQPAPASAAPGTRYTVSATLVNTGTATWRNGYGLLCDKSHHPQSACAAGAIIPFSGYSVAPGQHVTFMLMLAAPSTPGTYTTWWTLEQNGVAFGSQDVVIQVTVVPPTPTPTATATPTTPPPGPSATPHSS